MIADYWLWYETAEAQEIDRIKLKSEYMRGILWTTDIDGLDVVCQQAVCVVFEPERPNRGLFLLSSASLLIS